MQGSENFHELNSTINLRQAWNSSQEENSIFINLFYLLVQENSKDLPQSQTKS